jgi:hypothetical protein
MWKSVDIGRDEQSILEIMWEHLVEQFETKIPHNTNIRKK